MRAGRLTARSRGVPCTAQRAKKWLWNSYPSSHLDVISEKVINRSIRRMGITRIVVAHRPETILSADRVYILENGTLSEADRDTLVARFARNFPAGAIDQSCPA